MSDREIGCIEGSGGMTAVGQSDNDIRVFTAADADDRQLLSAEWMMRMGNCYESRRGLGQRGGALGLCRP